MAELARRLQLSTCTVSKILNHAFDGFTYAPETIRRVEAMARKLGYQPNVHARSLRTRRSQMVGLILPSGQLSFFSALTEGIETELRKAGYQVLVAHSGENVRTEGELVRILLARGVDGILWAPVRSKVRRAEAGLEEAFPLVLLDRPGHPDSIPLIATDNRKSAAGLAARIHEAGHRRITLFSAPRGDRSMEERVEGFTSVFGGEVEVLNMENTPAAARRAILEIRDGSRQPTVLAALSQALSMGALAGLRETRVEIPRQMSFSGFDDFPLAACWNPPITVVRQDIPGLAALAAEVMLNRIQGKMTLAPTPRVPGVLDWRESVDCPGEAR